LNARKSGENFRFNFPNCISRQVFDDDYFRGCLNLASDRVQAVKFAIETGLDFDQNLMHILPHSLCESIRSNSSGSIAWQSCPAGRAVMTASAASIALSTASSTASTAAR
jgi:hypothetical protein